ncbi:DNA cytosine methyltransferase [Acetobacteroides hydrogenigenes]|uniref:Cytosine-specific methyltransferase n=1 Tax=Acetobacteroides hydrogenigenes TaxID=979970 RepID=A0A4R2EGY8_9BACT|nr:DNA (cytosine-5-)-methyltransferase [Acetobacteroides hydrogenigenes]TCN66466.1 DNA (cytosine-5)-methyltransferase 1 [Acetobacteroides hydrogenigenes]
MNFIDLFSGAGGLSEGFIRAGFTPIAHVEIDKAACNTLRTRAAFHYFRRENNLTPYINYLKNKITRTELYALVPQIEIESVINTPIGNDTNRTIFERIDNLREAKNQAEIDLIVGGPPCQAYSVAGRSRDENKMVGDSRNFLFVEYAKYLEYYHPRFFVFENVIGLRSAKTPKGVRYLDMMLALFAEKGYRAEYRVLEAKDFGVLQNRRRIIIIGKRNGEEGFYPEFEKINLDVTVSEIFKDLPELDAGAGSFFETKYKPYNGNYLFDAHIRNGLDFTTLHIARPNAEQDKEIYKIAVQKWNKNHERLNYNDLPSYLKSHNNVKSFTDRFKVVAGDLNHSQTIVAHICKDGHYYIHPDIKQNRSITPREAARLQSFPDDYYFEGVTEKPSRTAAFKQIGNAVPPLMAEKIATKIIDLL